MANDLEAMRRELMERDLLDGDPDLQRLEMARCKQDCWYWLNKWVWTLDERGTQKGFEAKRRFPQIPYLKELHDAYFYCPERKLFIKKSRQMFCTWLFCAIHLWFAVFGEAERMGIASKKQVDTSAVIERMERIHRYLPPWMRRSWIPNVNDNLVRIPETDSVIHGFCRNAEEIRSYTLSRLWFDEMAFNELAEAMYGAAGPALGTTGMILATSTMGRGFFRDMVDDRLKMASGGDENGER